MEKGLEFFDAWVKSQKEFLDTWLQSQKEFLADWSESIRKLQESCVNMGSSQEGPGKETAALFNSWFTTIVNSSKVFSDEAVKIQETWKNTIEKQMEITGEMVKNLSGCFMQTGERK
jgi:hypothetical protein